MRHRILLVALILLTLAVNWPVLSAGQVYEDRYYTGQRPEWRLQPSRVLTAWTWQGQTTDRQRHAVNLGIHVVNGLLVAAVASSLGLSGWLCAALFLLHPIQSEAAGYLAARADLLMTTCVLLMVLALSRGWWLAALGCAVLAMGFKEIGVVSLLVLAIWPSRPVWLVVVVGTLAWLGIGAAFSMLHAYGSWDWVRLQAAGLGGQLTGLVLPWRLMLAPDPLPYSWLGTLGLFAAYGLVVAWSWASPVRRFACLWIVACLVLRFVIPTPQSVLNSHQMYAAMVGVCLFLGSFGKESAWRSVAPSA